VEVAADGQTGVELARQLKPAVITLDVMIAAPGRLAVLAALKADPATGRETFFQKFFDSFFFWLF